MCQTLEPRVQLLNSKILMTLIFFFFFFKWSGVPQSLRSKIIRHQSSLPGSQRALGLLNAEDDKVTSQLATVWRPVELTNPRNNY